MSVDLTIKGFSELEKKCKSMIERLEKENMKGMKIEAEKIMTDSKKNYVPVDKGTLRQTGMVGDPVKSGDDITVTLGYGGAAAAYATALHEHPSDSSPPTWEGKELTFTKDGTGPKYLERPLMKAVDGLKERIAERVKKTLQKEHIPHLHDRRLAINRGK
jgi:hypothetical protein